MTTHYMDEAEYCDRIAIMDHGQIIALDTPQALKASVGTTACRSTPTTTRSAIAAFAATVRPQRDDRRGRGDLRASSTGEQFVPKLFAELPGRRSGR